MFRHAFLPVFLLLLAGGALQPAMAREHDKRHDQPHGKAAASSKPVKPVKPTKPIKPEKPQNPYKPKAGSKAKDNKAAASKGPEKQALIGKQQGLNQERQQVQDRLRHLKQDLAGNVEAKEDAVDSLKESEQQISVLQRDLHELKEQHSDLDSALKLLKSKAATLENDLGTQRQQLEQMLYRHYLQGRPDSLQIMLNGNSPNQKSRDLYYLSQVGQMRQQLIGQISRNLARRKALVEDTKNRAAELARVEGRQKQQHEALLQQREKHQALVSVLSDRISNQRQEIGSLQQNEQRLGQLIDNLSRTIAANAAREKAAREKAAQDKAIQAQRAAEQRVAQEKAHQQAQEQARREAEARARQRAEQQQAGKRPAPEPVPVTPPPVVARLPEEKPKPVITAPVVENTRVPEPVAASFARLRGSLALPVRGAISGRFGGAREGGGTWRGLFIRAGNGSEVRAVAAGRVVFADWMRGFGNLLIIDHGDSYLSIYGNNDSVLKHVGSQVRGGDTVASVGNSGGNADSGLYFELRHQGQAIDPMKWVSIR